ncbi:hypothetical protein VP1G_01193 [Cytospora mali]|uniref:Uncharacterized protein n=1 Tax=Cytospora mali TaxID=578113 RepID=A0A194UQ45_CYTMA|nr:hypothetical protein VP1G_01193 [Valsa mali var. pyri (nom. inval.)]
MASQSKSPSSTTSPTPPASPCPGLDHIDIPYDHDALAQSANNDQSHSLPAAAVADNAHPFGVLNSIHFQLLAGRDTNHANVVQPTRPARIIRRNDFPSAPAAGDATPQSAVEGRHAWDRSQLNDLVHRVMRPSFPPHLEGVVETRHRSDAKMTEHLRGFEEIEDVISVKCEYGEKYRAFRKGFLDVEDELAKHAGRIRVVRAALSEGIRDTYYKKDRYSEAFYTEKMGGLVASMEEIHRCIRILSSHMGVMFACGRAVDQGAFPRVNLGEFDEMACSPKKYLEFIFPEFVTCPSRGPVDPTMPELLPLHLRDLISPVWDFSLVEVLRGEKRARLRDLWVAALAGDWEAVEDKTRGLVAVANELLAVCSNSV